MTEKGLKERKNTFPKAEHLKGDIRIASVMRTGKSFLVYPVKVIYASDNENPRRPHDVTSSPSVRLMVSVPKRRLHHAVDRNLIKRRMRESYRIAKHNLSEHLLQQNKRMFLIFRYVANETLDYSTISKAVSRALHSLVRKVEENQIPS